MVLGERLKDLRGQKDLSQGDLEKRTELLWCYISRVENGHTVPSVDTLEKMARAQEVPTAFHGRRTRKRSEYTGGNHCASGGQLEARECASRGYRARPD